MMPAAVYQRDTETFPGRSSSDLVPSDPLGWTEVGSSEPSGLSGADIRPTVMYLESLTGENPPGIRRMIKVELSAVDQKVEILAPMFHAGGTGETLRSAVDDLSETLVSIWEELRGTGDDNLDERARELRDRLATLF
jgi:hypothetical protein